MDSQGPIDYWGSHFGWWVFFHESEDFRVDQATNESTPELSVGGQFYITIEWATDSFVTCPEMGVSYTDSPPHSHFTEFWNPLEFYYIPHPCSSWSIPDVKILILPIWLKIPSWLIF